MKFRYILGTVLSLSAIAAHAENDYPTLDRVNYALSCMDKRGGESAANLTGCACELDAIAAKLPFDDFIDANAYLQNKDLPGDKGGVFRDSERAKNLYDKLIALRKDARKRCFVGQALAASGKQKTAPAEAGKPAETAAGTETRQ